jgi:phosphohistidine phosphatase
LTLENDPMPRRLLVLRHGKSAWDTDAATDHERPLAPRGRRDAPRMGRLMRELGLLPDHVVASPALRARETVLAACAELGVDPARIRWEERIYMADVADLLAVLAACPESARTVLLVGHNPGLENLVGYLCGSSLTVQADCKLLPTGALADVRVPCPWWDLKADCGELCTVTRPRDLTD